MRTKTKRRVKMGNKNKDRSKGDENEDKQRSKDDENEDKQRSKDDENEAMREVKTMRTKQGEE